MKISCKAFAYVVDESSGRPVAAPRSLDGWSYEDDRLENYLDPAIADQGVIGGVIRAVVTREGNVCIVLDYWSPVALDEKTIDALREDTTGQLEDGIGENGFEFVAQGRQWRLVPDLDRPLEVEQFDDGKYVPPPPRIAMAAREGDLAVLRDALASTDQDVNALHQGHTGLHLAIIYGHVDAALLLIAHGADANKADASVDAAPLDLCALSNSLSDEDGARIADALLSNGADPTRVGLTGESPRSLAEIRGKVRLAELLSTFQGGD